MKPRCAAAKRAGPSMRCTPNLPKRCSPANRVWNSWKKNSCSRLCAFIKNSPAKTVLIPSCLETAKAYRRMGDIYYKLGQSEKAAEAFDQAMALLEPQTSEVLKTSEVF